MHMHTLTHRHIGANLIGLAEHGLILKSTWLVKSKSYMVRLLYKWKVFACTIVKQVPVLDLRNPTMNWVGYGSSHLVNFQKERCEYGSSYPVNFRKERSQSQQDFAHRIIFQTW